MGEDGTPIPRDCGLWQCSPGQLLRTLPRGPVLGQGESPSQGVSVLVSKLAVL